MTLPSFRDLVALILVSIAAIVPFHPARDDGRVDFAFEVQVASSAAGELRLYFDDGAGLRESLAAATYLEASTEPATHRLRVPPTTLRSIRYDPLNVAATIQITGAKIVAADGTVVRAFSPAEFIPEYEIESLRVEGERLTITTTPGGIDPQLRLPLDPPLTLTPSQAPPVIVSAWRAAGLFALLFVLRAVALSRPAVVRWGRAIRAWTALHPAQATAVVAFIAAVASCHPVVFLGRSFVSPNYSDGTTLLYERFPTLPGYTDARLADANGADVGAVAWHHHPLSIIEHRAVLRHGELPLWNRYDSAGVTLLGQGQSMFGDPLHILPIVANGAAWAWDLKYLLAKWLFACGLGLVVLQLTRHTPAALLTAASSVFIGFFLYRANHPAVFSVCYSPWILYAWTRIAGADTVRASLRWGAALVVASHAELASGTAKEAYMLLITLNGTGAILTLARREAWRTTLGKLAVAAGAGVVFVMLSAPIWVTFLDALGRSYTSYNRPAAFQILPTLVLGFLDELFYRPLEIQQRTWNPSVNFLAGVGLLYALATIRRVPLDRGFLAIGAGAAIAFSIAFGVVPPQWIARVPFLGNVVHIDNTFSCVLVVHVLVLAGFGYRAAVQRLGTSEGRGDILAVTALLAIILVAYIAFTHAVHREPFGPGTVFKVLSWGERVPLSAFVLTHLLLLPAAAVIMLALARRGLAQGWTFPIVMTIAAGAIAMLWRHGLQPTNAFKPYVLAPAVRVDFHAPSPAIEYVRAQAREPWRVAGFRGNLFPGWSAVYDLEGISGPDAVLNPFYRELAEVFGFVRIWDWRLYLQTDSLARLRRGYDVVGLRYYLGMAHEDAAAAAVLPRVFRGDLDVYESDTAWPRAFFTDRVATYTEASRFGELVRDGDGRPFAAIQAGDDVTLPEPLATDLATRVVHPASEYRLTNNTTSFVVDAPSAGVIVLQEAWMKDDFRVTVNGAPAPYFRVNYAFKGIVVERPGTYRVTFAYWPRRLTVSLVASVLAMIALLAVAAAEIATARRRTQALRHARAG